MAKKATAENSNSPAEEDVQAAVANIEACYRDLEKEKSVYMQKAKKIRATMAGDYDSAQDKGISKKLLKKIIKERGYERKIAAITEDLEDDERSELEMLHDKLGTFANSPLGAAAKASLHAVGAA